MTEHGIFTTTATYWAHLHPLEPALYHYAVADCREYISANGLQLVVGHSKDRLRSATGWGYLIGKSAPFVTRVAINRDRLSCLALDWLSMTDREAGMKWGEQLILLFVLIGCLGFEPDDVIPLSNDREAQLQACDFEIVRNGLRVRWEGKTELVRSRNLFVQRGENGHKSQEKRESWTEMWKRPFDFAGLREPPA